MRHARLSGVMIGLVAVLVNVALVVGLVVWLQGSPDLSSSEQASSASEPSSTPSTSQDPKYAQPASVLRDKPNPLVVVLGGDEGVGQEGWVEQLTRHAAERPRRVSYSALRPDDPTMYGDATASGSGGPLRVRNGSISGHSVTYAAHRVPFLVPRSADVVLISYQPRSASTLKSDMDDLLERVDSQAGESTVALVLHPTEPDGSGGAVRKRQRQWAERHGVPTIDVARTFSEDDGELRSEWSESRLTPMGADLWARTVLDKLLGHGRSVSSTPGTSAPAEEPTQPVEQPVEPEPEPTATEPTDVPSQPTTGVSPQPTSTEVPPPLPETPEAAPGTSQETGTPTDSSSDPTSDLNPSIPGGPTTQ